MTNKIQGIVLLVIAIIVIFGDRVSENWAIIIAAVALVGMAVWEFLEGKGSLRFSSDALVVGRDDKAGEGKMTNFRQVEIKQEHLDKVLEMAKGKDQITNDDVQKALGVSDATAERYLQELESQGKVVQAGITGRSVSYRISLH